MGFTRNGDIIIVKDSASTNCNEEGSNITYLYHRVLLSGRIVYTGSTNWNLKGLYEQFKSNSYIESTELTISEFKNRCKNILNSRRNPR